jgi:hypothetical protein
MTFTKVCKADVANSMHLRAEGSLEKFWHHRLRHLNLRSVYALQSMVRGMNLGNFSLPTSTLICEACTEGKKYTTKLGNDEDRQVTKSLDIVHSSICGPNKEDAIGMGKVSY